MLLFFFVSQDEIDLARSPGPSWQDVLDLDSRIVPEFLRAVDLFDKATLNFNGGQKLTIKDANGKPQVYRGQTGSQSSIMPTMDALFGIAHSADPLRVYLDELHRYRPPAHQSFIENIRERSVLKKTVAQLDSAPLTDCYNNCILKATQFRTQHLKYAATYINKQNHGSTGNTSDVGTGGTPFMKYLKKHRDEAATQLL